MYYSRRTMTCIISRSTSQLHFLADSLCDASPVPRNMRGRKGNTENAQHLFLFCLGNRIGAGLQALGPVAATLVGVLAGERPIQPRPTSRRLAFRALIACPARSHLANTVWPDSHSQPQPAGTLQHRAR